MLRTPSAPLAALALGLALSVAGCNCDDTTTSGTSGELQTDATSIVFGELCLGGSRTEVITLTNVGSGELNVQIALAGADAALFSVTPSGGNLPSGGGTLEVTVTYAPTGDGQLDRHHFASVEITSDASTGDASASITIDGETSPQAPVAILSLDCGAGVKSCRDAAPGEMCCTPIEQADGRVALGTLNFGDTPRGSEASMPIVVKNLGCADLDVSEVRLASTGSGIGFCGEETVTLATTMPVKVPGSIDPNSPNESTVELRFAPTELCTYTGRMTVVTNDVDTAPGGAKESLAQANLLASGTEARIAVSRECLFFGDVDVGSTVEQTVHVSNVGTLDIDVSALRLRGGNADYAVAAVNRKTPDCNAAPESVTAPFSLAASNAALCGPDEVDVTITYSPTNPAGQDQDDLEIVYAGGVAVVCLRGGSEPELVVTPNGIDDDLAFFGTNLLGCGACGQGCDGYCVDEQDCGQRPDGTGLFSCEASTCANAAACVETCTSGEKSYEVCNRGRAPLHIADPDGVLLTGPQGGEVPTHSDPERLGQPVFELVNDTCSGASLEPGSCCGGTVRFTDSRNGGFKNAELHVFTDDPSYPRDESVPGGGGYVVSVRAVTQTDLDPVPNFVGFPDGDPNGNCNGASFCRARSWVVLDASSSTDDSGPISTYAWEFVSASGASGISAGVIDPANPDALCGTVNGGDCFEFVGAPVGRQIKFFPDIAGQYTFRLRVTDGICNPSHESEARLGVQVSN